MLIDESDDRSFGDVDGFCKDLKSDKVFTIFLTATAYEGEEDCLERSLMDELGYKIYKNSAKKEDFDPVVHETRDLKSLEEYRSLILKESELCGVLIYANGTEYASLSEEDIVTPVTSELDLLRIETMDAKVGPRFPVFMINEEYGGRGLNFRAQTSPLGITMLIIGSFPCSRARTQTLFRVGRFGDKCRRIKIAAFDDLDEAKNAEYKGRIAKALKKIQTDRVKACQKGNIIMGSPTEFADKHMSNAAFLLK
jgi:hypothetical protein